MKSETQAPKWDLPTRLIHWGLALALTLNLFVLEDGDDIHRWTGYSAVALVVLRFAFGFMNSGYSSLRAFPSRLKTKTLATLLYVVLWGLVLSMGVTGFMMGLDRFWGEEWLEEMHANLALAIKVFITLHLLGLTIDALRARRNTWHAMITGR